MRKLRYPIGTDILLLNNVNFYDLQKAYSDKLLQHVFFILNQYEKKYFNKKITTNRLKKRIKKVDKKSR